MTSLMTSAIPTELSSPKQSNHIRFVGLCVYIVLMIVDLWLIISLIHFGIKTRKWRRLQSGNPDLLSSGKIYLSVVFCYISALVYHIVVAVYRNYGSGLQSWNCSHYIALTNKFAKTLLTPDSLDVDATYQDFCNTIKKAAKNTIPRGYRNNYIPCWDAEC